MNIFDPSVFKISKDIKFKQFSVNNEQFIYIENFYEDLDKVLAEIKKLPYVPIGGAYKDLQNIDFEDYRQSYASSMEGTILAYVKDPTLKEKLSKLLGYDPSQLDLSRDLNLNAFRKNKKTKLFESGYYGVHQDKVIYSFDPYFSDQYAIVLYLNKKYSSDDGTNFYTVKNEDSFNKNEGLFFGNDDVEVSYFNKAVPNSAIVYKSKIYHGQSVSQTKRFDTEFRRTQVIWVTVFSNIIPQPKTLNNYF